MAGLGPVVVFLVASRVVLAMATAVAYEQDLIDFPDCSGGSIFETLWSWFTDCTWDTIEIVTALALGVIPGAPDIVNFFFAFIPNVALVAWVLGWIRGAFAS